ncbi:MULTISPECIES: hypothetical protein [unclassified Nocardioides]|uniref:hypothetical protein n=1 Tax=unclassified Nocardioides TaxID=2615069 RepID=UPI0030144145
MRTTLSIDDRVLAAARSRARREGISLGEAVSRLALIGYEAERVAARSTAGGFPMLPSVEGHVITTELVDDALDVE